MELKPDQIRDAGIRLDEAWLHFAKPKLKRAFNAPAPTLQILEMRPEKWGTALLDALTAPQRHKTALEEHARLRTAACADLRADLCARLYDAVLLAYAHQVAPTPTRTHRRIQPDFWSRPNVSWENDVASDALRTFQRIVIIDPAHFPELEARPRVGGHTERERIYAALAVVALQDDFGIKPSNIQRQRVRKELKRQFPQLDLEAGYFHDDTLQRHMKQYFEDNPITSNNKSE